jgi:ABC-2 type transport system permease protein
MSTTAAPAPAVTAGPSPISTAEAAWLVARREIRSRLRSKTFLVSTAILFLIAIVAIVAGSIAGASAGKTKVAVTADAPAAVATTLGRADRITVRDVADTAAAEKLVRSGKVDAAVVADSGPLGYKLVADHDSPTGLVQALSVTPQVTLLHPDKQDAGIRYLVALGFGLVFFMSAMTFGSTIAQSVVEEKQTRVIEILIAAIPARALLAGKIIGTSLLAFAQIAILLAIGVVGLTVTGQTTVLAGLGAPLVWFAVFFAFGFVLLAALFAATGALVSRMEDVASTTTPVTMLVMIPYFLVIFANDNPVIVGIMSYVPFSAPVGMPLRLFLGDAQWWEPIVALVLLAAAAVAVVLLGARVYERALLRLGARVPWSEALRG